MCLRSALNLYNETLQFKTCIAFFNEIEFVVLLDVGKFKQDFACRILQTPNKL